MIQVQVRNFTVDFSFRMERTPRAFLDKALGDTSRLTSNVLLQEKDIAYSMAPHTLLIALETLQSRRAGFDDIITRAGFQPHLRKPEPDAWQNLFYLEFTEGDHKSSFFTS
jgi:hypothetical protein